MRLTSFVSSGFTFVTLSICLSTCGTTGGGINLFSASQDIKLGAQVREQILSDPEQFPILPEAENQEVYRYVRGIAKKILNTGNVAYANEFAWEVTIIDDDETLNAFATPGGYIFVYTGLIKYLDYEHELAGVMGHEIAHSARRHSTRQMTQAYGLSAVTSILTGNAEPGVLENIAMQLVSLRHSRSHETEADEYSVKYLCGTSYQADGAAGFFRKLQSAGGGSGVPAFMSTHPDPGNRVAAIEQKAEAEGCRGKDTNRSEYARIKRLLD